MWFGEIQTFRRNISLPFSGLESRSIWKPAEAVGKISSPHNCKALQTHTPLLFFVIGGRPSNPKLIMF
jgi:hypothetical protein